MTTDHDSGGLDQHVRSIKDELATCDHDCLRCEQLEGELALLGAESVEDFDMLADAFRRSCADPAGAAFVGTPFAARRRAELEERKVADV